MTFSKPIYATLMILVALAGGFFFSWPQYGKTLNLSKKIQEKQVELEGRSAYYEKIADLSLALQDRQDTLKKVDAALPFHFSVAPLVFFINKTGEENNLFVRSVTLSNIPSSLSGKESSKDFLTKKVQSVNFTVNVSGSYQGLKNFLATMENSSRIFQVESISFESVGLSEGLSASQTGPQTYNFRLSLKTYTY